MSTRRLINRSMPETLFLAVIVTSFTAVQCVAEEPYGIEWIRQFGTIRHDGVFDLRADNAGNVYVTGHTRGTLQGTNPNNNTSDAFLAKFDGSGDRQWVEQAQKSGVDAAFGIAVDGNEGIYITGQTGESVSDGRHFLSKYTDVGTFDWSTEDLGAIFPPTRSSAVSADGLGNIFVSGIVEPESHFQRAYLAKYDEVGTLSWTREYDSTAISIAAEGVASDESGNVYVTGYTERESGNSNAYLAKYDSAGDLLWDHVIETTTNDFGRGISVAGTGDVYITGISNHIVGTTDADAFVAKYDPTGQFLWRREFGTDDVDSGEGVVADTLGNVYISGVTEGNLGGPNAGDHDVIVAKYNPVGEPLWTLQFGTNGYDDASGISIDHLGNIYVGGGTEGSLGGPNAGDFDAFLVKLSPPPVQGDFDRNRRLNLADVNQLMSVILGRTDEPTYDLTGDGSVTSEDLHTWVKELKGTWFGDATLDGTFDSTDLVAVFQVGKYERDVQAGWDEGDWNADQRFDSGDLVTAFQDGGYEKGPPAALASVPEPHASILLLMAGLLILAPARRHKVRHRQWWATENQAEASARQRGTHALMVRSTPVLPNSGEFSPRDPQPARNREIIDSCASILLNKQLAARRGRFWGRPYGQRNVEHLAQFLESQ